MRNECRVSKSCALAVLLESRGWIRIRDKVFPEETSNREYMQKKGRKVVMLAC